MSSSFIIYVRKKDSNNVKNLLNILDFTTSVTRDLTDVGILQITVFDENEENNYLLPFTKELANEIINFYNLKIESYNEIIVNYRKEISKLEKRIKQIKEVNLYKQIDEDIHCYEESILETEQEIVNFKCYKQQLYFVLNIVETNVYYDNNVRKELYELLYYVD